MHTVFINTAKKEIDNYQEIFEVQKETRQLISFECPFYTWLDEQNGYLHCVRQIEETIDSYKDVYNNYNLVINVDLTELVNWSKLNEKGLTDKDAIIYVLHRIIVNLIHKTIYNVLDNHGRAPAQTVILFEENASQAASLKGFDYGEVFHEHIADTYLYFLGMPSFKDMKQSLSASSSERAKALDVLINKAKAVKDSRMLIPDIDSIFIQLIINFYDAIKKGALVEHTVLRFEEYMEDNYNNANYNVKHVSFITNRQAGVANKKEKAKRDIRLCFYLLECIDSEMVWVKEDQTSTQFIARPFQILDGKWDKIVGLLRKKKEVFERERIKLYQLSERYTDKNLALAPELETFDHKRFGMDKYGFISEDIEIVEEEGFPEKNKDDEDSFKEPIIDSERSALRATAGESPSLLGENEYCCFDYNCYSGNKANSTNNKKTNKRKKLDEDEELNGFVKEQWDRHRNFFNQLETHVIGVMSNYAGRSIGNDAPILTKRNVNMSEMVSDADNVAFDPQRRYRYADFESGKDDRKISIIKKLSDNAYNTAQNEYLKFCAGSSVKVTDISESLNLFINQTKQIKKSLRNIGKIAIGLFIAILVLYIPFFVIQFEAITENLMTLGVALGGVMVPVVLLYIVFSIMYAKQLGKMKKVKDDFKKSATSILMENTEAVRNYDRLLTVFVPSLRWVYEYKLDVDFCLSCCEMAEAKIQHHKQKLYHRIEKIGNILEDLEVGVEQTPIVPRAEIDYSLPFCAEKNKKFYSIIDSSMLDAIDEA